MSDPAQSALVRDEPPLVDVLVVSGLSPVDADPWQAWLEARFPQAAWVRPLDGDWPDLDRWSARIDQALGRGVTGRPALVLAHGFGALAVIHHANQGMHTPASAILVTPAAPRRFGQDARSIGHPMPYKATLLAPQGGAHAESPWLQDEDAQAWAAAWNCRLVDAGRGPLHCAGEVPGATPPWAEGEVVLIEHMAPLLARARAERATKPAVGFAI
ncbi:MAG TPA: alpha/beta hydrolase [Burkholderiaceae bacterium]